MIIKILITNEINVKINKKQKTTYSRTNMSKVL